MPKSSKIKNTMTGGDYTILELFLALDAQDSGDDLLEGPARTLLNTDYGRTAGEAVSRVDLRLDPCADGTTITLPLGERELLTADGEAAPTNVARTPTMSLRTPAWESDNGKAILRPFPTQLLQVHSGRVWISPIDNWTQKDRAHDGMHRPTFKAFHWRAHGAEPKELAPPTALNEALLIVTSGEVDLWSEGQRPTRVCGGEEEVGAAWIGNANPAPWLPRTHLQVAGGGEARGLLFVIGEQGAPYQFVSGAASDGIRFVAAANADAADSTKAAFVKTNLNHGWRPTSFSLPQGAGLKDWSEQLRQLPPAELQGYPHERAIKFGNMLPKEIEGWRKLREGNHPRRPRLLLRVIHFPALRPDSRIGMATHNGVEALVALGGSIDAYMSPLDSQDLAAVQLAELRRDKATYERVHLGASDDGRPAILMLRPSYMHHAVVACGSEAFALLVGAAVFDWADGWVDLSEAEDSGQGALSRA